MDIYFEAPNHVFAHSDMYGSSQYAHTMQIEYQFSKQKNFYYVHTNHMETQKDMILGVKMFLRALYDS